MNILRFTWIFLDLFAQTADMYIYGAHVARVLIAPDNIQQVLSAVHLVRIEDEKLEHIELLRSQIDLASPMKTLLLSQSIRRSFTCTTFAFSSFGSWRAARRMMALMRAFTSRMLNGFVM